MKKIELVAVALCFVVVASLGCGKADTGVETETMAAAEIVVENVTEEAGEGRHDVVYVCNCGPECDCGSISTEAGNCSCGSELAAAHVVKVDGHDAMMCTCGGECDCEISAEDHTKCSCGADLRSVSLEGSGLYFCNCGGSCTCNHVSAEAGNCSCGMELKSV